MITKEDYNKYFKNPLKEYIKTAILDKMPDERDFTSEEIRRWKKEVLKSIDK